MFFFQTEVCDETFTKTCSISFLQETSPVVVQVCYNKAGKICDEDKTTEIKPELKQVRSDDSSTCVDVFETGQCWL